MLHCTLYTPGAVFSMQLPVITAHMLVVAATKNRNKYVKIQIFLFLLVKGK